MNKNYIELNGKRYDATTGALLGAIEKPAPIPVTAPVQQSTTKPATEVLSTPKNHIEPPAAIQPQAKPAAPVAALKLPRASRAHHGAPKPLPINKLEPSKTLMRKAVKKPPKATHSQIKRQYPAVKQVKGVGISPKLSVNTIDHARLRRSEGITKSTHLARFNFSHPIDSIKAEFKEVPVATPPAGHGQSFTQPMAHAASAMQEAPVKVINIFEQAIAHATSHQEPMFDEGKLNKLAKKLKLNKIKLFQNRQFVSSFAAVAAVVIIGGFVTYINKSSVQLQVASVKAGFKANMPSYEPEGYKKQPALTQSNKVAINFISPVDNSGFTLTQEPSDWDSQTLFDTVVSDSKSSFQTVQSHGRTIYVYGNNEVAWVDGGVLYKIFGNAKLKSDQIIALAASM